MDQQKKLYTLAKQLYKESFWDDYLKTDLIAIQLANHKEPLIISILGKTERNCGFLFHRNLEELACFFETIIKIEQQKFRSRLDIIQVQNCLSLEFEDRDRISKEEYQLIKESGVPFRGKKSWPIFVDYFPGYHPSILDALEIPLMIELMEKLMETAKDFREKLAIYKDKKQPSEILMRTYQKNGSYKDGLFNVPNKIIDGTFQLRSADPILLTSFEMKRVSKKRIGSSIWEMDIDFMNTPVTHSDNERPYYPIILLVVDSEDNEIICSELFEPGDSEAIQRVLIQLILSENRRPPTIVVSTEQYDRIGGYLEKLLLNLEIELIPIQKLPMISVFKKGMQEYL